jgi:hypothetical protein
VAQAQHGPARAYRSVIGYLLEAIIAPSSVAQVVSAALPGTRAIELGNGLELVPLVPAAVAAVSPGDERIISLLVNEPLPEGLTDLLRRASTGGPIAYVEADYFGGAGQQGSMLWEKGELVLGPLLDPPKPGPPPTIEAGPINRVLQRMGVQRSAELDEFATVALARHRDTEDWLA